MREWSRRGEMMYDVRLVGGASKEVSGFGKGSLTGSAKVVKAKQSYPRRKPQPLHIFYSPASIYLDFPLDIVPNL